MGVGRGGGLSPRGRRGCSGLERGGGSGFGRW